MRRIGAATTFAFVMLVVSIMVAAAVSQDFQDGFRLLRLS